MFYTHIYVTDRYYGTDGCYDTDRYGTDRCFILIGMSLVDIIALVDGMTLIDFYTRRYCVTDRYYDTDRFLHSWICH